MLNVPQIWWVTDVIVIFHFGLFFKLGFTPYKAEQLLQGMELQEKETQKD